MTDRLGTLVGLWLLAVLVAGCGNEDGSEPSPDAVASYDLVIAGGRVLDPESQRDATLTIGIRDGRVEAIEEGMLDGREILDATGLVVAPGFIDLH
ncbi:MAG: hypothetical protein V3T48_10105, partial [Vicinamibacterales bacterium]